MKYNINDTSIYLSIENTYELYPILKEQLEPYIESRPKINTVNICLNGLHDPRFRYSIGLNLWINTGSVSRLIEVDYLDDTVFKAKIVHKDGTSDELDNDRLLEIENDARLSDNFIQVMLDGVTLAFIDHMIEPIDAE